jgi:hypothetical protein
MNQLTYNSPSEYRPVLWSRVISVSVRQTSVGLPHDALQLQEFRQERGLAVVDFFSVGGHWEKSQLKSLTHM